jgi:hypothetical protein
MKEIGRLEVLEEVASRRITQVEAARRLGLSRRQVIRLSQQLKQLGALGLVSKRRGQASNNRLCDVLKAQVIELIKKHYPDFGQTLAHEKLTEQHQLMLSVESCRRLMIEAGIWKGKKRKVTQIHQMRRRRPCVGELIQIDGSPHDWFEGRAPKCTLLVFIDDASGRLMTLHFEPEESTNGYMTATKQYVLTHGIPVAYYSDRHGIFRVNIKEARTGTGETQFSRALRELGISLINANSSQAKGRVERANATLQDRLLKELRLRGVSDIVSANKFLPEFIADYNRRFAVVPASSVDAHRQIIPKRKILDLILCQRHQRTITKNFKIHYNNKIYQIQTPKKGYTLRGSKVQVCDNKEDVTIICKGKTLTCHIFDRQQRQASIASSKQINQQVEKTIKHKPAPDHPWRKPCLKRKTHGASGTHLHTTPQADPAKLKAY